MSDEASVIHQATYNLVMTGMGAKFKKYRKTPMVQMTPDDLPVCAVYIMRERRAALGDGKHGPPAFKHELTLGISSAIAMKRQEQDELSILEERMTEIDRLLLKNPAWVALTEAVLSMDRQSQYSTVGDTPVAEIRVEMVLSFNTIYEPNVDDDFLSIHVETRYPDADVDPEEVQQVVVEYDIPQN